MSWDSGHGDIAIVGISALFAGSVTSEDFWRHIVHGDDLITDVPSTHWSTRDYYDANPKTPDKTYARRGSFLPNVAFNPVEYGIPPSNLPSTDTSQLLALVVAKRVLEDAVQGRFRDLDLDRISVILGVASATELVGEMSGRLQRPVWEHALRDYGMPEDHVKAVCDAISSAYTPWNESTFPGLLGNVVAGRIANRLNLGGTNTVLDAACASSLSALSTAVMELQLGHSDLVITGGVDALNDIFMYMCFSKTPALSPTGDCRPFSNQADGTMLGEGVGMFALRRLADAERDGDHIYAVIKGIGSSSDGQSKSVYAPNASGQAKALVRAYERAGYGPETVELMEAHGTGTKAGDLAEFEGLRTVFADHSDALQWCALGSVKSQIGHTKAAAGAAGLFKAVMALHHKVLPPTIKVEKPNPALNVESSPFYLNTASRPWIRGTEHPRRASVSAFGFGGSNFHVALEEYTGPQQAHRFPTFSTQLLAWSAQSTEELIKTCQELFHALSKDGSDVETTVDVAKLARDTQASLLPDKPARLAVVAADAHALKARLADAIDRLTRKSNDPISDPRGLYYANNENSGKVAFLFPGQGSQYVGMGADVAMAFRQATRVWDELGTQTDEAGVSLHRLVFPPPAFDKETTNRQSQQLTRTESAQPAIGLTSLSYLKILKTLGIVPDCVGGHSFGEITALHCAGVLSETDLLSVASTRGKLMAEATGESGSMTAVFDAAHVVEELCQGDHLDVVVANYNSPKQCVVSGETSAIEKFESVLRSLSVRFQRLPVATAFHSRLVAPAVDVFAERLKQIEFKAPVVPVFANSSAAPYEPEPDAMRQVLSSQIARPVRFEQQIVAMYEAGVRTFLEVGPGSVLTGLVGQCLSDEAVLAVSVDKKGQDGIQALWHAIASLWIQGISVDFAPLWAGYATPETKVEKGNAVLTFPINGSNYGRPYPQTLPSVHVKWEAAPTQGVTEHPSMEPTTPPTTPPTVEIAPKRTNSASLGKSETAVKPTHISSAENRKHTGNIGNTPSTANTTGRPHTTTNGAVKESIMTRDASSNQQAQQTSILQTFHELQRQTAQAHMVYQQSMAQSHSAFLSASEKTFLAFAQLLSGQSIDFTSLPMSPGPSTAATGDMSWAAPLLTDTNPQGLQSQQFLGPATATNMPSAPAVGSYPAESFGQVPFRPTTAVMPAQTTPETHQSPSERDYLTPPQYVSPAVPDVPVMPSASVTQSTVVGDIGQTDGHDLDVQDLVLSVVSDKTGYPQEILGREMDLESDLGIDSIKRVEILSAVQDSLKESIEVDPQEMAGLHTIGEVIDYIAEHVKKNELTP